MKDVIRLLPDSVANQIAAGEVIQRPAYVIKELVENAVDAGADDIRIFIKDAGRTLIQVTDNGCGMSETDARMAFERHATSKIRNADDLFTLHTMGFRGEALPSVCAISHVELRTRRAEDTIGTRLVINGSKVECQEPDVCEKGTTIMVRNLFFNVPARRKFLKSDNVELSNIMREFERLALVNTGVRMSIDTGSRTVELRKGNFRQRISDLWKGHLGAQLLPVEADTSIVKISGYISRPESARRRNALQYLIVNGRNIRHPYFHKAIMNCYESLIAAGTMPCYFIRFDVDPASIDVNIHPTKNEIKFDSESQIWSILTTAVKASLGKFAAVPSIDFDHDPVPVEPLNPGEEARKPTLDISSDYNPFDIPADFSIDSSFDAAQFSADDFPAPESFSPSTRSHTPATPSARGWDALYEGFMKQSVPQIPEQEPIPEPQPLPELMGELPEVTPVSLCLQYAGKYIITTTREGVVLIDQYRAHFKILYERFIKRAREGRTVTQTVMFPETLDVPLELQGAFADMEPRMRAAGFIFDADGDNRWLISGVPAILEQTSPSEVVLRILESACDGSEAYGSSSADPAEEMVCRIAAVMARSSAIKGGQRLRPEEMEEIVAGLFSLPDPAFTPNGHRIFTCLDEAAVAKLLP